MPFPHFILAGVPKAGTTSMYEYLRQHPQIFMPEVKEPHFFSYQNDKRPSWAIKRSREYTELFDDAKSDQILGEASTWYAYSHTAAQTIYRYIPGAKIIIIIRNPVERAYSEWSFCLERGWETINSFEEALDAEPLRIQDGCMWDLRYLDAGLYHEQIKRYFSIFGRNQVRIIVFDDLKERPQQVMSDIFHYLEVDTSFIPDVTLTHNTTRIPRIKWLNEYLIEHKDSMSTAENFLPKALRRLLRVGLRRVVRSKRPPLSPATRSKLKDYYTEEISRLQSLVNLDLSHWH